MAALASLMREHDCTECLFDIFLQKNRFLTNVSGCLCYKFVWAVTVCSYMSVLINTNHIIQQSTIMPLTVDQYSADTWHLPYRPGVDQYTKISTHTPSTYIINQHLVWHVVECGSTCWSISWSSCQVIVNRHILSGGVPKWQGYFAERRTLNAECWTTLKFCD